MKITVAGAGYVGMANAVMLAGQHEVTLLDIDQRRVDAVQAGRTPIVDADVQAALDAGALQLTATTDAAQALTDAAVLIIATPTDYDPQTNLFDTRAVESVLADALRHAPDALVAIKSTIPVGYTERLRAAHPDARILFSPEFLREGHALRDNREPSRVIVGDTGPDGRLFAELMLSGTTVEEVPVLLMQPTEAEAVKLFANTYLALRVAYFNELDTYAAVHGLDPAMIIGGVGLDPRIGQFYNNPSFGYGGYCLPKDTKQMLANYADIPQNLITAVVEANNTRKDFVAGDILARQPQVVGVHRLVMKADSDNFRSSSIQGVMRRLAEAGVTLIVFEPALASSDFQGWEVLTDLDEFKRRSDVIVSNRWSAELADVAAKVYTRDIYGRD